MSLLMKSSIIHVVVLPGQVRDIVGKNPLILVGTKMDLLPEGFHPRDVAEWLTEAAARKHLNVVSCHLVSSKCGYGVSAATSKICRERKGRDVYVVGAANVRACVLIVCFREQLFNFLGGALKIHYALVIIQASVTTDYGYGALRRH
jgi:nitric-oxide synthase